MRLEGKTAIVTGASSGIGRAIALLFAKEGAKVVAAARRMDRLEELAAEGGGAIAVTKCDVTVESDILALYDFAREKFGRIDIVVNNAGALDGLNDLLNTDKALWDRMILTNLTSVYMSCKRALEVFFEQGGGGAIVNMASVASVRGMGGGLAYTAAKHGVMGLTKCIAAEYRNNNTVQNWIRCNAILPCNIHSEVSMACYDILNMDMAMRFGPIGGATPEGQPDDVAYAALYLASDESRYINGVGLLVDDGAMAV